MDVGLQVFVVDTADPERMVPAPLVARSFATRARSSVRARSQEENKTELTTLLDDEALKGIPLMVLANKQDLVNAMAAGDVRHAFE